jgi:hypothetical protein
VSDRCKSCLRSCRCISVATEAAGRGTNRLKPSGQRPTVGGSASRRAATCVKPEQASNVMMRGPTGLNNREGLPGGRQAAGVHGSNRPMTMDSLAGVRGVARRHSTERNTGDPRRRGVARLAPSSGGSRVGSRRGSSYRTDPADGTTTGEGRSPGSRRASPREGSGDWREPGNRDVERNPLRAGLVGRVEDWR